MTRIEQLHIGLVVCEAVLKALIQAHPEKDELRRELNERLAALQVTAAAEGSFGETEEAHLKATIAAFLARLNGR